VRIERSDILMQSESSFINSTSIKETMNYWNDKQGVRISSEFEETTLQISAEARKRFEQSNPDGTMPLLAADNLVSSGVQRKEEQDLFELSDEDKLKIQLIESFIAALTGKKIKLLIPERITLDKSPAASPQEAVRANWGFSYDRTEHHIEAERTQYTASGTVRIADGREIQFSIDLEMSRHYESYSHLSIRAGDAKLVDPLVINLSAAPASLTANKYTFDLNADGQADQISFVGPGSGFLAVDHNGDGIINDGSELFGALSGDGFQELRTYDEDQNGWIDENDSIFDQLQIWMKDAHGYDQLIAIGQVGIGAIYLGSEYTSFTIKNALNQTNGQVRQTGVYLRENGTAGTLQQIDLAI
jgi:hypothetical protein